MREECGKVRITFSLYSVFRRWFLLLPTSLAVLTNRSNSLDYELLRIKRLVTIQPLTLQSICQLHAVTMMAVPQCSVLVILAHTRRVRAGNWDKPKFFCLPEGKTSSTSPAASRTAITIGNHAEVWGLS